jgi:NAD-dependent dihydropyrimidine dehydrogenase PreA subunit
MTSVIAEPCIDAVDRTCVDEWSVDCIYEGSRALYIQPDECADRGAGEPVCPVQAISFEDDVPRRFISMCIGAKSTHPCQPPP